MVQENKDEFLFFRMAAPIYHTVKSEWAIKFNSLSGDSGQRGPYSPYKPCNHSLYIGIIIFPHIDNTQSTDHN